MPALARDDSVEVVGERSKAEIDAKKRKAAVVVDDDEGPALKAERASTSSSGGAAASSSSSAARAPELMELLREAGVGDKVAAAEKWCEVRCEYGIELRSSSLLRPTRVRPRKTARTAWRRSGRSAGGRSS